MGRDGGIGGGDHTACNGLMGCGDFGDATTSLAAAISWPSATSWAASTQCPRCACAMRGDDRRPNLLSNRCRQRRRHRRCQTPPATARTAKKCHVCRAHWLARASVLGCGGGLGHLREDVQHAAVPGGQRRTFTHTLRRLLKRSCRVLCAPSGVQSRMRMLREIPVQARPRGQGIVEHRAKAPGSGCR